MPQRAFHIVWHRLFWWIFQTVTCRIPVGQMPISNDTFRDNFPRINPNDLIKYVNGSVRFNIRCIDCTVHFSVTGLIWLNWNRRYAEQRNGWNDFTCNYMLFLFLDIRQSAEIYMDSSNHFEFHKGIWWQFGNSIVLCTVEIVCLFRNQSISILRYYCSLQIAWTRRYWLIHSFVCVYLLSNVC